jgi:hypothetical protein
VGFAGDEADAGANLSGVFAEVEMSKYLCPAGWVYFCTNCGRTSRDKTGTAEAAAGWNEKCVPGKACFNYAYCVEERFIEFHPSVGTEKPRVRAIKDGAVLREYPP